MYRDVVAAGAAYAGRADATSDETVREPTKNATTRLTTRVSPDFLNETHLPLRITCRLFTTDTPRATAVSVALRGFAQARGSYAVTTCESRRLSAIADSRQA